MAIYSEFSHEQFSGLSMFIPLFIGFQHVSTIPNWWFGADFAPIHSRDAPPKGIRKMTAEAGRKSGGLGGN
jgi:hypothetical protein